MLKQGVDELYRWSLPSLTISISLSTISRTSSYKEPQKETVSAKSFSKGRSALPYIEGNLRRPAQLLLDLSRIAEQQVDLRWTEDRALIWMSGNHGLTSVGRKYLGSTRTSTRPCWSIPISSTPLPCQLWWNSVSRRQCRKGAAHVISSPTTRNAFSTNSRIECVSPG